jgi:hypothetical protein
MKFCCDAFQELYFSSSEKGFSVEGAIFDEDRYFLLVFKPFARAEDDLIERNEYGYLLLDLKFRDSVTLCTKGVIPIRFCPICGENLSQLISGQERQFDKMVKAQ